MAPGGGVRVAQGVGWWAVSMVWVVACLVGGVLGAVLPSVLVPPTGPYPLPVPPPTSAVVAGVGLAGVCWWARVLRGCRWGKPS